MKKVLFVGALGALLPLVPAKAVVLEQKWHAGQDLSYQTDLNGTLNLKASPNAPFLWAGVPLEVEVHGTGTTLFNTLDVDDAGTGTVAMRVPLLNLTAQTLMFRGQLALQNNSSQIVLNGKPIKYGGGVNPLAQPKWAWRISPKGQLVGFKDLTPPNVPTPATPTPAAPTQAEPVPGTSVPAARATNRAAQTMASIAGSLPALWPGRDVQPGETWKADVSLPVPSKENPNQTVPQQFGEYTLTLKGVETIDGKTLQRVGVVGSVAVDSTQIENLGPKTGPKTQGKAMQNISGDLWFDADAGQVAKADLVVGGRAEGGKSADDQTWMDFTGTLKMQLKSTT